MNLQSLRCFCLAMLLLITGATLNTAEGGVPERVREGDRVELEGEFRSNGDRITFTIAQNGVNGKDEVDQADLRVLENLALQRVAEVLKTRGGRLRWKVVGEMTEFQGENFLLVRRAIIAPKDSP